MEPMMENPKGRGEFDEAIERFLPVFFILIFGLIFFVPMLLGMLLFSLIHFSKKEKVAYITLAIGVLLLLYQFLTGDLLAYLAIFKEMNVPYIVPIIEKVLNRPLEMNFASYLGVFAFSMVFSFAFFLFAKYFWKKKVTSKQSETQKRKAEDKYITFRKNRVKFLDKQQMKYRKTDSKETFIGYTDFKERVTLDSQELNYHMLALGGTGTGKTTLLGSIMESAMRNDKPIIFVDGKGEHKAMMEFKAFCEAYGKKVYMFTEDNDLTYNPMKHGTPTEIRDKVMNLFEWSEPYYKTFSSRYLQLVIKLIDKAGLPRDLKTIYALTSLNEVGNTLKMQHKQREIEEEIEVEIEEEVPVPEAGAAENDMYSDLFADNKEPEEPKKPEKVTRKEIRIQKKTVQYLEEGLQRLKTTFDKDFSDEDSERCLTGLKNQLGELLESDLGHLFEETENGIDLQKITDEGNVVIFSISGSRYRDYIKMLGRIVVLDVNSLVAYRQKVGKKSILAIYDEFSAYGNSEIVDIVNKARSAGFECIISTQTLADIDAVDPLLTDRILSNCNTFATGRVNSSNDAERIAAQFGTFSDHEVTSQVEKKHNLRRIESEMGTVREVERFKAHPNDIKNLQIGEIFINRKMKEEGIGETYFRRVYVRNAFNLGGIEGDKHSEQPTQKEAIQG